MFRDTSNSGRLYRQMQALLAGEPTNDVIVASMNTLALAVGASVTDLDAAKKVFDAAYSDATAATHIQLKVPSSPYFIFTLPS